MQHASGISDHVPLIVRMRITDSAGDDDDDDDDDDDGDDDVTRRIDARCVQVCGMCVCVCVCGCMHVLCCVRASDCVCVCMCVRIVCEMRSLQCVDRISVINTYITDQMREWSTKQVMTMTACGQHVCVCEQAHETMNVVSHMHAHAQIQSTHCPFHGAVNV